MKFRNKLQAQRSLQTAAARLRSKYLLLPPWNCPKLKRVRDKLMDKIRGAFRPQWRTRPGKYRQDGSLNLKWVAWHAPINKAARAEQYNAQRWNSIGAFPRPF